MVYFKIVKQGKIWARKINRLKAFSKSSNRANKRGASFELAAIFSIRPDYFYSAIPDYAFPAIAPRDFDIGFADAQIALEFFSPERNAIPIVNISDVTTNNEAERLLFDGIRGANAQPATILMLANSKLLDKNAGQFEGQLLLLIDSYGNDLLDDYFDENSLVVERIRADFRAFMELPELSGAAPKENLFHSRSNLLLAIAERNSCRLTKIHFLNGNMKQQKLFRNIFWLANISS